MKCCLCDNEIKGRGNNSWPFRKKSRCCNDCNYNKVIPARLKLIIKSKEDTNNK